MWNHIRKCDVWFEANMGVRESDKRTVSVAWGLFYRLARHEMTELSKRDDSFKSHGHFSYFSDTPHRDEKLANEIDGNYATINDAIWLWFLGSYSFADTTRYNNETFLERILWFFKVAPGADEDSLYLEFPNLLKDPAKRILAMSIAYATNYHFFSRPGIRVPEKSEIKKEYIFEYFRREAARSARKAAKSIRPPVSIRDIGSDGSQAHKKEKIMSMFDSINKDTIKSPEKIAEIEAAIENALTVDDINTLTEILKDFKRIVWNYQVGMVIGGYGIKDELDDDDARSVFERQFLLLNRIMKKLQNSSVVRPVKELAPFEGIISEYVVKIGDGKGPGSKVSMESTEPTPSEIASFYPIYEILKAQPVEIYLPQDIDKSITAAVREEISKLNKRIRERNGDAREDAISIKPFNSINLGMLLKQRDDNVKRVFIANNSSIIEELFEVFGKGNSADLLKGNRFLTADISQSKNDITNSIHQMWMIKVGILSCLLNNDNMITVGVALKTELSGKIDVDVDDYVGRLAKEDNSATRDEVLNRITYFTKHIVKLSELIGEQIRMLRAFKSAA